SVLHPAGLLPPTLPRDPLVHRPGRRGDSRDRYSLGGVPPSRARVDQSSAHALGADPSQSVLLRALFADLPDRYPVHRCARARAHGVGRAAWHTVMSLGLASVDLAAPDHTIVPLFDDHAPLLSGEMLARRTDGQCRV